MWPATNPKSRSLELHLPGGIASAAAIRHWTPPRAPGGVGGERDLGADREPAEEDGGHPSVPRVRRPRGAPPHPGAAAPGVPPSPPGPAVVAGDAEPGAAGGATRGERRGEGRPFAALGLSLRRRAPLNPVLLAP